MEQQQHKANDMNTQNKITTRNQHNTQIHEAAKQQNRNTMNNKTTQSP